MVGSERVRYADTKPYEAPSSLDDLCGPTQGLIELPATVIWAPFADPIDIGTDAGARLAYHALLSEGTVALQCRYIDAATLVRVWPDLLLPDRVIELWQSKFPVLAS